MDKKRDTEYVIYCDESDRRGPFFSNFYGGVRIGASKLQQVIKRLAEKKQSLGLNSEIKWAKVDATSVDRYKEMMRAFFAEMEAGHLVMRIMFTKNALVARGLTSEQCADEYYILYYQFLKHAFGLQHMPPAQGDTRLRVNLDQIGDTREQIARFRGFITGLAENAQIRNARIKLAEQDVTEIRSHEHILLQCLDVVLGSMPFRLNNKHLEKPIGKRTRGKRTVAKESLYKFILEEIRRVSGKPNFNIGITTGVSEYPTGRWRDPYLHWVFKPKEFDYDSSKTKPSK